MFTLITLPYAPDGLEPVISAQTLGFHHGKHLLGYVNNLNKLVPGSKFEGMALEEIVKEADGAVFNNAGQVLNHNLYFTQFREIPGQAGNDEKEIPGQAGNEVKNQAGNDEKEQIGGEGKEIPGHAGNDEKAGKDVKVGGDGRTVMPGSDRASQPQGALKAQIEKQWGSVEAFQAEFEAKGATLFGSGWVWLSATSEGELQITQEPGAHNPVEKGLKPLLTFDVWEHAYYLDYQNRRPDHLHALWSIVNWQEIERRYTTK